MVAPHAPRPPSPASTRSKLAGCNLLRARDALAEVLSCGVLLFNEHDEILLAHATGNRHWDVPKGLAVAALAAIDPLPERTTRPVP